MVRNVKRAIVTSQLKAKFTKRAHKEIEVTKEKSKDCKKFMAWRNYHEDDDEGDELEKWMK